MLCLFRRSKMEPAKRSQRERDRERERERETSANKSFRTSDSSQALTICTGSIIISVCCLSVTRERAIG
jgi:hypothetical protein